MKLFHDLPIQKKLLVSSIAICGVVLLAAFTAIFVFQLLLFRADFQRDTATLAAIIAKNSTASLAFEDPGAAAETLASLKAKPTIICAHLLNAKHAVIARYGDHAPKETESLALFPPPGQFLFHEGLLLYSEPVTLEGKVVGMLHLRSDFRGGFLKLFRFYGFLGLAVFTGSVMLAAALAAGLRRFLADPILSLAETARIVGERNDYSVRSSLAGQRDELGLLAKAFNHMLSRIQYQDVALNLSQQKLASLVNSIDGIVWEWNPDTSQFTYISCQSERILGYPPESWLSHPGFWDRLVHPDDLETAARDCQEAVRRRLPYHQEYRMIAADGRTVWIHESAVVMVENDRAVLVRGIFRDITEQKKAAEELDKLNRQLVDTSRQAGMAEVATGVLHNVGNVLNSVNVSATLLLEKLSHSEVPTLARAVALMQQQNGNLASFLTSDPKGRLVPTFIAQISEQMNTDQDYALRELRQLAKNVDHIKEIVGMQQSYARVAGVLEKISLTGLVEDALQIDTDALARRGVQIVRRFDKVPALTTDKHKVLQILINLIRNARFAMQNSPPDRRILTLSVTSADPGRVRVVVEDTGVGIAPENLTKIFSHGFTTRKDGHGFGLHLGALNAKELGGSITATSAGVNQGATFVLELPAHPPERTT